MERFWFQEAKPSVMDAVITDHGPRKQCEQGFTPETSSPPNTDLVHLGFGLTTLALINDLPTRGGLSSRAKQIRFELAFVVIDIRTSSSAELHEM